MRRLDRFLQSRWVRPGLYVATALLVLTAVSTLVLRQQLGALLTIESGRMPRLEALLPGAEIRAARSSWGIRGVEPYVRIDGLDLRTREGMRLRAAVAAVELDTLESLGRLTPILGRLQLERAELVLRQRADGSWAVPRSKSPQPWTRKDTERVADLLWESDRIAIDGFTATFHPRQGQPPVRLTLNAQLSNRRGDHRARVRLACGGVCGGVLDYTMDGTPLLGIRNGGMVLALRGLPRMDGVLRVGDAWLDVLDNRVSVQAGVEKGVSVLRGAAQFGVRLRGAAGALAVTARSSLAGGGHNGYDVRLPDLTLALNGDRVPLHGLVIARRDRDWFARLPAFRLEALLQPVARAAVLSEVATRWLTRLAPRARMRDLRLHAGDRMTYAVALDGLTIEPYNGAPEIRGANALLSGHAAGGRIELLPGRFTLGFPDLYPQAFAGVSIAGPIDFWYDRGLTLHSGVLQGDSGDMRINGRFALYRPDDPRTQAFTLILEAADGRTKALRRYLPEALDPPLHRWLNEAIGDGEMKHAMVALHGYSNPQPGRRTQVEVVMDVADMGLRFQPRWPALSGIDGRVVVSNEHLFGDIRAARAGDVELASGRVTLLPHERHLGLDLAAHTSTVGLIAFLRASPVREQLPWLAEWDGDGEFDLTLRGRVSLDDDRHDFTVESRHAATRLANARLHVAIDGLSGPLRYRYPAFVESSGLQGRLNGERLRLAIASSASEIRMSGRGTGDGAWLENWLPWPMAKGTTGSFEYASDLRISTASASGVPAGQTQINLTTDLVGLGLLLPAPLTKLAAARRPARFRLRSFEDDVQLAYDDPTLAFRGQLRGGNLARGVIGLGRPPEAMPVTGLRMSGAPRELDVLAWSALIAAGEGGTSLPVRADLAPARVLLGDLDLPDGKLSIRSIADRYRIEFDQRDFEGAVDVYRDQRPMHLALRRARLPRKPEPANANRSFVSAQSDAAEPDPLLGWRIKEFPPMSVDVAALYYGDELLGRARFDLQPVADGIELRGATGTLRALSFNDARLTWRRDGRGDSTRFFGLLKAGNVGPVLESFGYAGSLSSKELALRADLGWRGSPLAFRLRELDGSAEITLKDGRFVQVEGANAARLLGIFDFASIARRARLDFTDVFGKGLSFDEMSGRLQFASGTLSFPDALRVEGPGSEFRVGGSVDLATGTLSNDMIVTLPLSRTLPWYAAYAAFTANPLAGAGVLVAERLFRNQLNQFSSAKYHVSGTIDEPLVTFVSVFDRKLEQPAPARRLSQEPAAAAREAAERAPAERTLPERALPARAAPARSAPERTATRRAPSAAVRAPAVSAAALLAGAQAADAPRPLRQTVCAASAAPEDSTCE